MEKTGWKITAIVSISLFLLETLLFVWLVNMGTADIEKDNECSINVCADYETYYYDTYNGICYCYTNHEVEYQEYMG